LTNRNVTTAAEQGAAPDRLQLRSLRSCLASVSSLPAAGELGRSAAARGIDVNLYLQMKQIKSLFMGAVSGLAIMLALIYIVYGVPALLSSSPMPKGAQWNHTRLTFMLWAALLGAIAGLSIYGWKKGDTKKSGWLSVIGGALVFAVILYQILSGIFMRADLITTYELLPEESIQPWLIKIIFLSVTFNLPLLAAIILAGFGIWLLAQKKR
jgi:hypothetical protein